MALFWIAIGVVGTVLVAKFIDDQRNAQAFKRPAHVEIPVATVIIRADRDVAADITRALARPSSRWN